MVKLKEKLQKYYCALIVGPHLFLNLFINLGPRSTCANDIARGVDIHVS